MREDPAVFLLGQDIAEYGGAFKVTKGFVEEFGKARVINTPISESGAIGMGVGAALLGRRPVVEMQFADFITCGFNQVVNVAAKMYWRTRRAVPLVIRCPFGGGAGAGAFHSQSLEAWFTHAAGLKVVAPAFPGDAYGLLRAAIRDPDPVLFLEHKYLYRRLRGPLPAAAEGGLGGCLSLGRAQVIREGQDVTAVAWGWMVHRAAEAAAALAGEGVSVEVVDLSTLVPLDEETLLSSARKTGKVLIVHEAPLTGGFGGEVAARVAEKAFEHLDGPVRRLAYPDLPVPYNAALEAACLPSVERIAGELRALARW
jgi:pyruvate/2-oxoglutarate/acetoin dehydrogenase E1 component